MLTSFNRKIDYLRISVTDKCNLRCLYCMPEDGVPSKEHADILTFEEIERFCKDAAALGITKVRLTGGEPLVKKNIEKLVKMISDIDGINEVAMTTNGILLPQKIDALIEAGLSNVNISLDTLDAEKYAVLTRRGNISDVLNAIKIANTKGLLKKINMVIMTETSQSEVDSMQAYCEYINVQLQTINRYSLEDDKSDEHIFDRPPKCSGCNKIRLLHDKKIMPCLHSNTSVNLSDNYSEDIIKAVESKPLKGDKCNTKEIFEIGG